MLVHLDGLSCADEAGLAVVFTKVANFLGLPAISTPMGYDKNDMPIGIQFMAKWVSS